jgi:branched-chain amino acid transport system ATP-binding protein
MNDALAQRADLACTNLRVTYGTSVAVHGLDLSAPAGAITALLGPNAAGKTSTLLALYGAVRASGQITVAGADISVKRAGDRRHLGLALMPQGRQLFPSLTVEENLRVVADVNGLPRDAVSRGLACFPVLRERRKAAADVLSGGQQRMLGLARAIMVEPRILLLDEAVDGLAVGTVKELMQTVRGLAEQGVAVLMAEPTAGPILQWIDRGYVMLRGHLRGEASSADELESLYETELGLADAPMIGTTVASPAVTHTTTEGTEQ